MSFHSFSREYIWFLGEREVLERLCGITTTNPLWEGREEMYQWSLHHLLALTAQNPAQREVTAPLFQVVLASLSGPSPFGWTWTLKLLSVSITADSIGPEQKKLSLWP